jgi:hypothetical protein
MIPPNVGPPKSLAITYPGAEEMVRKQLVYLVHIPTSEQSQKSIVPGNRLMVTFKGEVVGEGQAILVEPTSLEKLTPYDAMQAGCESLESLQKHVLATVLKGAKKPKETPFVKILYRWL